MIYVVELTLLALHVAWVHKQNQTKRHERKMETKRRGEKYDTLLVQLCRQFGREWKKDEAR